MAESGGASRSTNIDLTIRTTLEDNVEVLAYRVAIALKAQSTQAYRSMEIPQLLEIARGAVKQTTGWMESNSGKQIEEGLREGSNKRLALGYTLTDFVSTTDIIEREFREFCKELFVGQPDLLQRCEIRLSSIYTIVRMVETRMVMLDSRKRKSV